MWQSPIVTAAPAVEPVTADEAKQYLRLDGDAFDAQLAIWIAGARQQIEAMTGTRLITQTVTIAAGSFDDLQHLPIGPVREIVSVSYLDQNGDEQQLDADLWEAVGAELDWSIRPAVGARFPSTADVGDAIRVAAKVGYGDAGASIPQPVKIALLQLLRGLQDDRAVDVDYWLTNFRIWG